MNSNRRERRSSRMVAYVLVLGALLAVCNAAIQPVSSQMIETSTLTQINTATYFTVAVATSDLYVTYLTVQYTTNTTLYTIVTVQFTTLTSNVTGTPQLQEGAPPLHAIPSSSSPNSQPGVLSRTPSALAAFTTRAEGGLILKLMAFSLLFLGSILLVLRKRS